MPAPQKLQFFSGDPKKLSWRGFITKFDRVALLRGWFDNKKLDRLFDCLTDKELEYANRAEGRDYYLLKNELALQFNLRDEPVATRQRLHIIKQSEEESLEDFLQRVLTVTIDGYDDAQIATLQQLATEAFLQGCKYKDAATLVMNESPKSIQEICRRVKTIIVNKKAVGATKVLTRSRRKPGWLPLKKKLMTLWKLSIGPFLHTDHLLCCLRGIQRDHRVIIIGPDNSLLLATEMAHHIASLMSDIGRNTGLHPDSLVGTGEAIHQIGVLAGVAMIGDLVIRLPTIDRLCLGPQHTLQITGGFTRIPNTKMGNGLIDSLLDHQLNKLHLGPTIVTLHTLYLGPRFKALPLHNLHRTGPKVL